MSLAEIKALLKDKQKDLDHKKMTVARLNKTVTSFRKSTETHDSKLLLLNTKYDRLLSENNTQYLELKKLNTEIAIIQTKLHSKPKPPSEEAKSLKFQIEVLTNKTLWLSHENNILREKESKTEAVRRLNQSERIEITKYVHTDTGKKVKINVPECPICLEYLCDNLKAFYPCGHVVHSYCC